MKKLLVCALALGGFAASAQAADLSVDSMKDPLPDTLSYAGVTLYGTVDVGYSYQTNGAPQSNYLYTGGMDWNMYGAKQNREAVSGFSGNGLSQSLIGVKIEENVGMGFVAIAKAETGFNPWSGELADACGSLAQNNGKPITSWNSGLDGSRCGQALNGEVYAGLSNATYGTLKIGRQNSLDLDLQANYDPMALSYAFSLLGFSGGAGAGIGTTETARWDNSLKYIYQYGPAHAEAMYASGNNNSQIQGDAIAGGAGFTWKGFSADVVYTKERGDISSATITTAANLNTTPLSATVTDNEAWTIGAKYAMNVPALFEGGCSFKDECDGAKLTFFGGYQHADLTNSSVDVVAGDSTIGGYQFASVNNTPFAAGADRILQTEWAGAKYEMGPWSLTAAYYHLSQDAYTAYGKLGSSTTYTNNSCSAVTAANKGTSGYVGRTIGSNCAGDTNTVSGVVDYTFNKHFDVYTGVAWSDVSGGLSNSFVGSVLDNTTWMTGLRLKF